MTVKFSLFRARPKFNTLQLRDGRTLAYSLYGAPESTAKHTFLLHHGFLSSRLEAALLEEGALSLGARIISFDRPGCGASDHDPARTPQTVAEDAMELLDELDFKEKIIVMGVSGGAPYAAACAAVLPERTRALLLLVPFAQIGGREAELTAGMHPRSIQNMSLVRARPWLLKLILHIVRLVQRVPHGNLVYRYGGFSRVDLLTTSAYPSRARQMSEASWESSRRGIAGSFKDMEVMTAAPVELERIACKAVIWAGEKDVTTPLQMARFYCDQIPHSELRVVPEMGHFMGFQHNGEALQSVL